MATVIYGVTAQFFVCGLLLVCFSLACWRPAGVGAFCQSAAWPGRPVVGQCQAVAVANTAAVTVAAAVVFTASSSSLILSVLSP